jgi:coniferyl-aldehyde dehydrogenase
VIDDIHFHFARQRADITRHGAPSHAQRIASLEALAGLVRRHRHQLVQSISSDFGHRPTEETELGELVPVLTAIEHASRHLKKWMKPVKRRVGIAFRPAVATVVYQPLGIVGILAPWNYPLNLTLLPLTDALAAGNRVMIKPSELAPRTGALLRDLIRITFPPEQVSVVTGGPELAARFCALPFDHLLFTGSTRVGKQVMAAAAANLTPVTLELGGKSPVVVFPDYPLERVARMVAIGKFFNAGQTCVAPDYALVPRKLLHTFAEAFLDATQELYPFIAGNKDYASIFSEKHYARLVAMIAEAQAAGATIKQLSGAGAHYERKIPPTVLTNVPLDTAIMREEIFGPVMPVIAYDSLDEAIAFINEHPKPLALYCFSSRPADIDYLLGRTSSGGVTINGTMLHAAQADLPFGGVGESGMGAYHGFDGFVRFSHARSVLKMTRLNMSVRIAAPYGQVTRLITRFLLRK